jgi:hypothetical protein
MAKLLLKRPHASDRQSICIPGGVDMKAVCLFVVLTFTASPVLAQQSLDTRAQEKQTPIRASMEKAAAAGADQPATPKTSRPSGEKGALFWSGLALGVAGAATSALGLTALRTEDSSTGNAPTGTYQACVARRDSNPIYAGNQCGVLKAKNLKLLWGGVALGGAGAVLMIHGMNTSAELSPGSIGLFHHLRF